MVPIYTILCVFSIEFYDKHVYIASGYEFYESLVIASFFMLLCQYIRPDFGTLQAPEYLDPRQWILPIRFIRCLIKCGRKPAPSTNTTRRFNVWPEQSIISCPKELTYDFTDNSNRYLSVLRREILWVTCKVCHTRP